MAEAQTAAEKSAEGGSGGGGGKLGWIVMAVVAGGLGAAVPYVLPADLQPGHGQTAQSDKAAAPSPAARAKPAYIEFGEVVVNLNEGLLNRYLNVVITLQVDEKEKDNISRKVTENRAVLRSWLLSYLSDKDMQSIRGTTGQNRLRREIQDQFNTVLFPDGYDRIHQVLFEKFNIQ